MTMVESLLRWLVDGCIAGSGALLLVMLLRRPLRRACGARVAYWAWALVPLALAAAALPRPDAGQALAPQLLALHPGVLVLAGLEGAPGAPAAGIDWMLLVIGVWLGGAMLAALRFARQQRRFLARLGRLERDAGGHWRGASVPGPAVVGALRPRIVLPADLESRHGPDCATLVVAHECAHLARGDTRANLVAVVLRCLYWFNPIVHLADRRFRLDQELACDAAVIARHPHARRRYADAMLNMQLAVPGLPVGCHWQSSQSLKERILMLKQPQPAAGRRRAGILALGLVLSGCSYLAWSARPAQAPAGPGPVAGPASSAVPAHRPTQADSLPPPAYPADAAKAGLGGLVLLKVLVAADGSVREVEVERSSPEGVFDAVTLEAVRQWRFTPRVEGGKAVEGWVRVPVKFEADPIPAPDDSGPAAGDPDARGA